MTSRLRALGAATAAALLIVGCGDSESDALRFSQPTRITNRYYPLAGFSRTVLEGTVDGVLERSERTRLPASRQGTPSFVIGGQTITPLVIEDRSFADGELVEVALDYYAQDDAGTVFYLGEDVDNYEDGVVVDHDGSWRLGEETTTPGVVMPAAPAVDDAFDYENVPGITVERQTIVSVSETLTVPLGTYQNVLRLRGVLTPGGDVEHKWYAPDIGEIRAETEGADGAMVLVEQE